MAVAGTGGLPLHPSKPQTWLRTLSLLALLSAFALVVLGGVVRVTGSGLGCPDWPLCHGRALPPLETEAIIEYAHRLVASALVGPLVLATAGVAWLASRHQPWLTVPAGVALLVLVVEGALGGVTVVRELPWEIVTAHLALGEALVACLVVVLVAAHRGPPALRPVARADRFPVLAVASAAAVYVLIMLGSYVTGTGATGACPEWPLCLNDILPEHRLQIIHMVHRVAAAITGLLLMYSMYHGFRPAWRPPAVRLLSLAVLALFLAEVMAGAAAVWLKFPVELRGLHLGLATAVWVTIVAVAALTLTGQPAPSREASRA